MNPPQNTAAPSSKFKMRIKCEKTPLPLLISSLRCSLSSFILPHFQSLANRSLAALIKAIIIFSGGFAAFYLDSGTALTLCHPPSCPSSTVGLHSSEICPDKSQNPEPPGCLGLEVPRIPLAHSLSEQGHPEQGTLHHSQRVLGIPKEETFPIGLLLGINGSAHL